MPKLTDAFHVEMERDEKGVETGNYVVVPSTMYEAEAQQAVQKFPDEWFAREPQAKAAVTKLNEKWAKDRAKIAKDNAQAAKIAKDAMYEKAARDTQAAKLAQDSVAAKTARDEREAKAAKSSLLTSDAQVDREAKAAQAAREAEVARVNPPQDANEATAQAMKSKGIGGTPPVKS